MTPLLVKHSEKIRRSKRWADARRLDTHLKSFQVGLGDQDKAAWAKQETMKCGKKHKDPLGAPLEYMKAHKVFMPLASSAYGLCCFYDIGLKATKGLVPISCPLPKAPVNHIVLFHYDAGHGCGKCVEEVFITSQSFKECDGLSCDSTDAGRSLRRSPRRPAKDKSPRKRQDQPSKKASAKGNEHAPAGASRHKKKKAQKK